MTRHLDYSHLSPAERLLLVQEILDSILAEASAEPLTPAQIAEIDRRVTDIDSGKTTLIPWDDVRASFMAK